MYVLECVFDRMNTVIAYHNVYIDILIFFNHIFYASYYSIFRYFIPLLPLLFILTVACKKEAAIVLKVRQSLN